MASTTLTVTYKRGGVTLTASVPVNDPVASPYPSATNRGGTGVPRTAVTKNYSITTPNQVLENLTITGFVQVNMPAGKGFKMINCEVINPNDYYPVAVWGTGSSVLGEDRPQFIDSTFRTGPNGEASLIIGDAIVRRCKIGGSGDGIKVRNGNVLVEDSYIYLDQVPAAHHDGIDGQGSNNVYRHNTIDVKFDETSCITIQKRDDNGVYPDNVLVEDNLLSGAGYSVYGPSMTAGSNIRVINNKFSTSRYPNSGSWGTRAYWPAAQPGMVWSGNTWIDGPNAGSAV